MSFTVIFSNAREVVRAEKACVAAGVAVAVVPAPESAECGMALRVDDAERDVFGQLMEENGIKATILE